MYKKNINAEKHMVRRYTKKNQREELTGESNLLYTVNIQIGKSRIAHFSLLNNLYKDSVDIQPFIPQFEILMIAPGNDKSNTINKIMVKRSKKISE